MLFDFSLISVQFQFNFSSISVQFQHLNSNLIQTGLQASRPRVSRGRGGGQVGGSQSFEGQVGLASAQRRQQLGGHFGKVGFDTRNKQYSDANDQCADAMTFVTRDNYRAK